MLQIQDWIDLLAGLYDQYGYWLVFLGSLGENTALLGLLLPGGTLALLGAFYARLGTLSLPWVIFFAWLGTVLGYHADYLFGRFVLTHVAARLNESRLGRRMRLAGRIRLARALLAKHGGKAILISHLIGHLRSFVALSAGLTRMRYRTFLIYELVAALVWNTLYGLLGYFAGTQIDRLQLLFERFGWGVVALLIILFLGWRFLRPQLKQRLLQARRQRHLSSRA
ncbi:MAG TPA: DedA family protein [Ktedonobacteraceae bacterium]|nr:DedA family protein [Ktedonobacteraceae bacterium]HEU5198911.1 DedA family protein [Ktedonobacterales bacterium]